MLDARGRVVRRPARGRGRPGEPRGQRPRRPRPVRRRGRRRAGASGRSARPGRTGRPPSRRPRRRRPPSWPPRLDALARPARDPLRRPRARRARAGARGRPGRVGARAGRARGELGVELRRRQRRVGLPGRPRPGRRAAVPAPLAAGGRVARGGGGDGRGLRGADPHLDDAGHAGDGGAARRAVGVPDGGGRPAHDRAGAAAARRSCPALAALGSAQPGRAGRDALHWIGGSVALAAVFALFATRGAARPVQRLGPPAWSRGLQQFAFGLLVPWWCCSPR